jgi:hypothetical protein
VQSEYSNVAPATCAILQRPARVPKPLAVALLALASCAALDDLDRTGGNSNKGYFAVSPEADLAEGAKLTFTIGDYETVSGSRAGIDLEKPRTGSSQVATIASFDGDGSVEVKGVKAGKTDVEFTAKADDQTITDSFSLRVVKVTSVSLANCASNAVVARGRQLLVRYAFNEKEKRDVLGRGYYPIQFSPESAVRLDKSGSNEKYFSLYVDEAAPPEVTVSSSISADSSTLKLSVVDESDIDGVAALSPSSTRRGTSLTVDLTPQVNGRPLCGRIRRVLKSLNLNACSIAGATNGILDTTAESATVSLDAVDACQLLLEFPDVDKSFILGQIIVTETQSSEGSHSIDFDD